MPVSRFDPPAGYRRIAKPPPKNRYEGAATGRRLGGWNPSTGDANHVLESSLPNLRHRARQQVRDNPRAHNMRDSFIGNMIGTGITPQWRVDGPIREEIEALWRISRNQLDADEQLPFSGLQELVAAGMYESGSVLARRRPRRITDGLAVPLQIQLLEPDHLDRSKDGDINGASVKMGIQFSRIGGREGYWLHKAHPAGGVDQSIQSVFVPASEIAHVYRVERPGQVDGVPWLSSVLVYLYELDKGEDAQIVAWQVANMLTGFIRSSTPVREMFPNLDFNSYSTNRDKFYQDLVGLAPGELRWLFGDDEIEFTKPPDSGSNFDSWLRGKLRAVSSGGNLTYEQVTGDLEKVNYSSIRAGLIELRRRFEMWQQNIINFQFNQKVMGWWMDAAVASGRLQIPDYQQNRWKYLDIEWVPDPWDYVDPMKDRAADILDLEWGLDSRAHKISERGRDIRDVDRERNEDTFIPPNQMIEAVNE